MQEDLHGIPTQRVNHGNYPALYYETMHLLVGRSLDATVIRIRLVNSLVGALLLGTAVALAAPTLRRAVSLSWLVTTVPLATFFIPSTNPSSWTITGLGTYWAFLITYLTAGRGVLRRVSGVFCAVSAILTLGSRADGAAFLVLVTVAIFVILGEPKRLRSFHALLPCVLSVLALYVFLTTGQSASIGGLGTAPVSATGHGLPLLISNIFSYPILLSGVWGIGWGLGWFDTFIHPSVGAMTWGSTFAVVSLAASHYDRRKLAGILIVASAILVVPLIVLQGGGNFVGDQVQPRYLLPLVLCGVGLALFSWEHNAWSCGRGPLRIMAFCVGFANAIAIHTNLRRYVTGLDIHSLDLNFHVEWWWNSPATPMDVWFFGAVGGAALFWALARIGYIDLQVDERLPPNYPQEHMQDAFIDSAVQVSRTP